MVKNQSKVTPSAFALKYKKNQRKGKLNVVTKGFNIIFFFGRSLARTCVRLFNKRADACALILFFAQYNRKQILIRLKRALCNFQTCDGNYD